MTNLPYTDQDPTIDWVDRRYTLRDVSGDKIGELIEVNPDYVIAESDGGFLGLGERHQYYVPRSAVSEQEGSDWYLSITKDQVENQQWSEPPATSRYATGGWRTRAGYDDMSATTAGSADRTRLVRYEEELQAQPVQRQAGEVVLSKDVVEETQTIEVPVRREEVHVERRPVTGDTTGEAAFADQDEAIRIPVMEEQVQVTKVARPVEEVVVSKTQAQETQRVSDTVRKEQFDIEGDPDRVRRG